MFTPYERRQLRQIEEWFEQDDPHLARALRSGPVKQPTSMPQVILIAVAITLGLLGVVTGAGSLIFSALAAGVVALYMASARRKKDDA